MVASGVTGFNRNERVGWGMAHRLVVDLTDQDQVVVSTWHAGELAPSPIGEPYPVQVPLDEQALEDLRWYVEDYLRVPYGVYKQRGPQVAARIRDWGQTLFEALFGSEAARLAYAALRPGPDTELLVRSASARWLSLPWELAWDPMRPAPLAVELGRRVDFCQRQACHRHRCHRGHACGCCW